MYKLLALSLVLSGLVASQASLAEALLDPTRPLGYVAAKKSTAKSLRLNSVLISDVRKVAVINGRRVKEQETIKGTDGVMVAKILPHEVVVKQGNKTWRLNLGNKVGFRHKPTLSNERVASTVREAN